MAAFAGLIISFGGGNIMICFLQGVSACVPFGSPKVVYGYNGVLWIASRLPINRIDSIHQSIDWL